jgi:hypothetical protein
MFIYIIYLFIYLFIYSFVPTDRDQCAQKPQQRDGEIDHRGLSPVQVLGWKVAGVGGEEGPETLPL